MSAQHSSLVWAPPRRFGLAARLGVIALVLVLETLLLSYVIQGTPADSLTGIAAVVRDVQHWLFRFMIAYAGCVAMLVFLAKGNALAAIGSAADHAPVRFSWAFAHAALLVPFAVLTATLYAGTPHAPFLALAIGWHACAIAAAVALTLALAPLSVWSAVLRQTGALPLYALIPAAAAVLAIQASQHLWATAARLSFRLVQILLYPFCPGLRSDPATLTLSTSRFAVQISDICSGLEGVGLMLVFCTAWLWYYRREYFFPRALVIVPAALLLVFLLNAVRIGALLLIGDAGYERIATVGFHSQAGWIAFNLAAFTVALIAKGSPWFNRNARQAVRGSTRLGAAAHAPAAENAVAPYLMPLLAILAAGMLAHALSEGFDVLYPLRLAAGAAVLWCYRRRYRTLDWRFSGRALGLGTLVFALWVIAAHAQTATHGMPEGLARLSPGARNAWIACRIGAAVLTVPIAEELAYRGYLLRRLVKPDFESVSFREIRWPALAVVSVVFGATHGALWLPGIAAGLAFGLLVIKTGRIGEAAAAHAIANALLAGYVLSFDQWQLW